MKCTVDVFENFQNVVSSELKIQEEDLRSFLEKSAKSAVFIFTLCKSEKDGLPLADFFTTLFFHCVVFSLRCF